MEPVEPMREMGLGPLRLADFSGMMQRPGHAGGTTGAAAETWRRAPARGRAGTEALRSERADPRTAAAALRSTRAACMLTVWRAPRAGASCRCEDEHPSQVGQGQKALNRDGRSRAESAARSFTGCPLFRGVVPDA